MGSSDLSPLQHSWPLFERDRRFDLGLDLDPDIRAMIDVERDDEIMARFGVGAWSCELDDNRLTWSTGVYDMFGLPRGESVARAYAVALYEEASRAAMERLRAYAIRHRRGFTLDVEIHPATGGHRWIRLLAAPVCVGQNAVRLQGFKRDVTDLYARPRRGQAESTAAI
ncbi:MAG: hypothetical protein EOP61_41325 [Sphingomonadales bacterium]|nr:MAG: hypothetical protein EOP61_41325 [Sphingomonadales bacterium]